MFEPLKDLIGVHGDKLYELLSDIKSHLGEIAYNTISEIEYEQYTDRSDSEETGAKKTAIVEFTPNEGFSWKIERVAITCPAEKGLCAVYLDSVSPLNLLDILNGPITAVRGRYFVPRGRTLLFHFYEQTGEKEVCTVHIQAEQYLPPVKQRKSHSGSQSEAIQILRQGDEVPSGDPIHEVSIP